MTKATMKTALKRLEKAVGEQFETEREYTTAFHIPDNGRDPNVAKNSGQIILFEAS